MADLNIVYPSLFISESESNTEVLGSRLGKQLHGGMIIALFGNLGSGKTVLSRGIARALNIVEPITSPTFTLVQEYVGKPWTLHHIDLYRLHHIDDVLAFGIDHYWGNPQAITVIEWPERAGGLLKSGIVSVKLEHINECRRLIAFNRN
jgi:tRNA threonylcarbamoyladenosine biosynthesis protein TsaE